MAAPAELVLENDNEAEEPRHHSILLVLFATSGCAALIYEIVWFHLLRLVIGASALSMGLLLASFMGGMCLGSFLLARLVPEHINPLRVYAVIEIGIGALGLLLPVVFPAVRSVYFGLFGYGWAGIALRAIVAAIVLLPPTALMGATLPAVARRYQATQKGMSGLAFLYGANTAGAVLGCLLTGFYILPNWDVIVATVTAAALNFAIGAVAFRLSREPEPRPVESVAPSRPVESIAPSRAAHTVVDRRIVYAVIALSGMTALGAQVVWTRLLALLFGGTIYTFAIILAVFLGGLGVGSALSAFLLRRGHDANHLLAWSQILLVTAMAWAAVLIAKIIPYTATLRIVPIHTLHVLHVIRCLEVVFPAAVLWGMSFPLALAAASSGETDTGRSSGNVYAANTVGAIVGSLGTSFITIPVWGTRVSQQILVCGAGVAAYLMSKALRGVEIPARLADKTAAEKKRGPFNWLAELPIPAALLGIAAVPALPPKFQAAGRYIWTMNDRDSIPYLAEGVASTVAVRLTNNHRYYHVAGKVEASTDAQDMRLQRLLGHLSALAHPKPESILVVGLGAGVTAGSFVVHPEVKRIVICEIEPRVLPAAAQHFAEENHRVLSDPRVEVVNDDARHFLATTEEKFDVITSDPIHPWVRGNSVLFSREYYTIVKQRLNPGGLATQWVPLYETSEEAIKIQLRTFVDAFPNSNVWNSQEGAKGYDVVLLGQVEPVRIDVAEVQQRIDGNPDLKKSLAAVKLGSALDLFASYAVSGSDLKGWLKDTPVNLDFSLKLEYISGLAFNLQIANDIYASMIKGRTYPQELFVAPPETASELRRRILAKPLAANN